MTSAKSLDSVFDLVGGEHDIGRATRTLTRAVREHGAPAVGAFQISCSDECEKENVQLFHREFVQELLPELKFWKRAGFRTANLGGRYEPGSAAIAEDHYAIPASEGAHKLVVIKVSSHVSVTGRGEDSLFGRMARYRKESVYCGALDALLAGARGYSFLDDLGACFSQGGLDRVVILRGIDPSRVALFAAITNTSLQAERARRECETLAQKTPTLFLIMSTVTLNRIGDDTELTCGVTLVDRRTEKTEVTFRGATTDPRTHAVEVSLKGVTLHPR